MNNKENNKQIVKITVFITSIFVIFLSMSYAFLTSTLTGSKSVVLKVGVLDLVLEEENEITLENAYPMYDEVGMIQKDVFKFRIANNTSYDTNYTLYLNKVDNSNELSTDIVKYYLTKDGEGTPELLSAISTDNIIDKGIVTKNQVIRYELRLWIDSSVNDDSLIDGKSLSYKISVDAIQDIEESTVSLVSTLDLENRVDSKTSLDFSKVSSETNGRGIYKYTEDGEDIYYFRGAVTNNHIIFGGYCWEIVRTTKTGGVKMIYDGEPVDGKCSNNNDDSTIGDSQYNPSNGDNAYVGYMYGLTGLTEELSSPKCVKLSSLGTTAEVGSETDEVSCQETGGKWVTTAYEATHANVVNSTIKTAIDNWFSTSNLNTKENLEKIEDAVYCNDRSIDTTTGTGLGYGTNDTFYSGKLRNSNSSSTIIPSLECTNLNDRFTVSSEKGNGSLTYPVGLITIDELVLAGYNYSSTKSDYYLHNIGSYWPMSPYGYNQGTRMFFVVGDDLWVSEYPNNNRGIRPVISLNSNVEVLTEGDGTEENPYIVK